MNGGLKSVSKIRTASIVNCICPISMGFLCSFIFFNVEPTYLIKPLLGEEIMMYLTSASLASLVSPPGENMFEK